MSPMPVHSEQRQLRRLETLLDVVFGITIWRLFMLLPRPEENPEWTTIGAMLADSWLNFVVAFIALIIVIIYWKQSNLLFRYLLRTDSWHVSLTIMQVFALLLFLYSITTGVQLEANATSRIFESATACLLGVFSFAAWHYALNRGQLVTDELDASEARAITERIKAEPVTAAVTIPFAMGMWMWELSWFLYPLIVYFYTRNKTAAKTV